jgi:hypothetical protein
MADQPEFQIQYVEKGCPDCGKRVVELPVPLPAVGDDFDWLVRDYDGFRLFMLEQLAARFPERSRWTPADMEVVLVETLAVVLDQLSDMLDRVQSEASLQTARDPRSVRRLLKMIGYDAVQEAGKLIDPLDLTERGEKTLDLEREWLLQPRLMEQARQEGPARIHTQRRMITLQDYAERLEEHPLVLRTSVYSRWTGSWQTIYVATILVDNNELDSTVPDDAEGLRQRIESFHKQLSLPQPFWSDQTTIRSVLDIYLDAYRMAGQEVLLVNVEPVGIAIDLSLRVGDTYFQSEVRCATESALGNKLGGFFQPGRLRFGEDVNAGDIMQQVLQLDGVEAACLNRFKRVGKRYPDQTQSGRITLDGLEIAVCDNDPQHPEHGRFRLTLHGGQPG